MTFSGDINRFRVKMDKRVRGTIVGVTREVKRSVVEGSELTGAPGQPVDTGNLKNSWTDRFTSPSEWELTTNVNYAPDVEENARGVTFKNHGPHSVKLTRDGFGNIVEHGAQEMQQNG